MRDDEYVPAPSYQEQQDLRRRYAAALAEHGGLDPALAAGAVSRRRDVSLAEALVLGLVRQGVRTFVTVLGHGSTEVGEVLRVYEAAGVVRTCGVRSEIEASHAAAALRWVRDEKAAVVTSIGPGALQAGAASLVASSNGLGVYYLVGDETTGDEGPNMQQVPRHRQGLFFQTFSSLGEAYCLHTPDAVGSCLRRGLAATDHPHRSGPFFVLMPLNTQPKVITRFNLDELPGGALPALGAARGDDLYREAARQLLAAERVVVKVGAGGRHAGKQLHEIIDLIDGTVVLSPNSTGAIPFDHPRNMQVGGSKGSICGNFAMENADLLLAVGTRFVCQSDCSRTGYPNVERVITINTDIRDATHYGRTTALWGECAATLDRLCRAVRDEADDQRGDEPSAWMAGCAEARARWEAFKQERFDNPTLDDPLWGGPVLTQPAAIKVATDWARKNDAVAFFDAGDVQANGFQLVEDDRPDRTFSESGASYMGFAASALLATGLCERPFYGLAISGDGSLTMNPQVLIDGVQHGATGCILVLDNRRMAAISALQTAQYGREHATWDRVAVDYVAWARAVDGVAAFDGGRTPQNLIEALSAAKTHGGLSLVWAPVYYGDDPLGGLGAFGRWNVGNWVEATEAMRHDIGF